MVDAKPIGKKLPEFFIPGLSNLQRHSGIQILISLLYIPFLIKGTVQPFEGWFLRRSTTLYNNNSRSVNSMFLTLKMLKNVKNIEITDLELCLIDFPS